MAGFNTSIQRSLSTLRGHEGSPEQGPRSAEALTKQLKAEYGNWEALSQFVTSSFTFLAPIIALGACGGLMGNSAFRLLATKAPALLKATTRLPLLGRVFGRTGFITFFDELVSCFFSGYHRSQSTQESYHQAASKDFKEGLITRGLLISGLSVFGAKSLGTLASAGHRFIFMPGLMALSSWFAETQVEPGRNMKEMLTKGAGFEALYRFVGAFAMMHVQSNLLRAPKLLTNSQLPSLHADDWSFLQIKNQPAPTPPHPADVAAMGAVRVYAPAKKSVQPGLLPPPPDHPRHTDDIFAARTVFSIRSAEEAHLIIKHIAETAPPRFSHQIIQACQNFVEQEIPIPIHWTRDPTITPHVQRTADEAAAWETTAATTYGITIRGFRSDGTPATDLPAKVLFHEMGHALPQEFMAQLYPDIPWCEIPTKQDSYVDAVRKSLTRMAMQEAYAESLAGTDVDLPNGNYLGDNHILFYSLGAALEHADRLRDGRASSKGWKDSHQSVSSDLDLVRLRQAFETDLKNMVMKAMADPTDPLCGFMRRLAQAFHSLDQATDITKMEVTNLTRDSVSPRPTRDLTSSPSAAQLTTILDRHARNLRRLVNVFNVSSPSSFTMEQACTTLGHLIPQGDQARFWPALANMHDYDNPDSRSRHGFATAEGLLMQGFITAGMTKLQAIYKTNPNDRDQEFAFRILQKSGPRVDQIGRLFAALCEHGPVEAVDAMLDFVETQGRHDFLPLYQHLLRKSMGKDQIGTHTLIDPEATPQDYFKIMRENENIYEKLTKGHGDFPVDTNVSAFYQKTYQAQRPSLDFFLKMKQAQKALEDRGMTTAARRIADFLTPLAGDLPTRFTHAGAETALTPVNLRALVEIAPEAGGGWEAATRILEALDLDDSKSHPQRVAALIDNLAAYENELPLLSDSLRARLADVWTQALGRTEYLLTTTLATHLDRGEASSKEGPISWQSILYPLETKVPHNQAMEYALRHRGSLGRLEDTKGTAWCQNHALQIYRFAAKGNSEDCATTRVDMLGRLEDEADGAVIDAQLSKTSRVYTLHPDTHYPKVAALLEEAERQQTIPALAKALKALESSLEDVPDYHQMAYARLIARFEKLVAQVSDDLTPTLQTCRNTIQRAIDNSDTVQLNHWYYIPSQSSASQRDFLWRRHQAGFEVGHFHDIIAAIKQGHGIEAAFRHLNTFLERGSIYDPLLADEWLQAAEAVDHHGNYPELTATLYRRALDVAEMQAQTDTGLMRLPDRIDRSTSLTTEQKDSLLAQVVDMAIVATNSWVKARSQSSSLEDLLTGKQTSQNIPTDRLTPLWERLDHYPQAQKRFVDGLMQVQKDLLDRDPFVGLLAFNGFVQDLIYRSDRSCIEGNFVNQHLSQPRVLGESLFQSPIGKPLAITHRGAKEAKEILSAIDPTQPCERDAILSYRFLTLNDLLDPTEHSKRSTLPLSWQESIEGYTIIGDSTEDTALEITFHLMHHYGVKTLEDFFTQHPDVAATFFFAGVHPLVTMAAPIAETVLTTAKDIPIPIQEMAMDALYQAGRLSPYVWNHFSSARRTDRSQDILQWVRRRPSPSEWKPEIDALIDHQNHHEFLSTQAISTHENFAASVAKDLLEKDPSKQDPKNPTSGIHENDIAHTIIDDGQTPFYDDAWMVALLDETGNDADARFRQWLRERIDNDTTPLATVLNAEKLNANIDWLEGRAGNLTPAAAVHLPPAFDRIDSRIHLALRIYLAELPPAARRHILRKLGDIEDDRPEAVLQRLTELTNLPGVAQFMSKLPPAVMPESYRKELLKSEAEVPFSTETEVRQTAQQAYGETVYAERFTDARFKPIAAGKAGEIWQVTFADGSQRALKFVTPSKKRPAQEATASLIGWARRLETLPDLFKGLDIFDAVKRYRDRLKKEMDLESEADHLKIFNYQAKEVAGQDVVLPNVYFDHPTVLEMDWLNLQALDDHTPDQLATLAQTSGQVLAQTLVNGWLYPDPHGKNLAAVDGQIALVDFGQLENISEAFLQKLNQFVIGVISQDASAVTTVLEKLVSSPTVSHLDNDEFKTEVHTIVTSSDTPSQKMENLLGAITKQQAHVTWELSEILRTTLYWEGAFRDAGLPHQNFIATHLAPALWQKFKR